MNSTLKNGLIAAAVATVLGTGAAQALAPSASIATTFYAAGGSAQENAAFYAAYQLMQPSTVDVYTTNTSGGADSNYLIVTGTTNATANTALGITSSENILFIYRFGGGSFPNGIEPQANSPTSTAGQVVYPTPGSLTVANTASTGVSSPATTPASPTYKVTNLSTASVSPDWGVSDEEVSLFNHQDNLNGSTALTAAQLSALQQDGIYDDVFGFAVTNAVYNGTSSFKHAKTSFTKEELEGVLSGAVQNWNQLFADDGTQMPNLPLWFLDRGSGSGSKAAGNQYILNYPGGIGTGGYVSPGSVTGAGVNAGYTDTILSLSGGYQDVKESSNAAIVSDLQSANGAGDYAIAVLAAEFVPAQNQGSAGVNQYSFAKIGGVGIDTGTTNDNINGTTATQYTNVVTGAYDFVYQNSFNTRSGFLTNGTTNAAWATAIRTQLQSEKIAGANSQKAFPNAVTGVLIDPANAPAQDGGVVLWSRLKNSTAPIQLNFDATDVNSVGGVQAITFGSDPL
jgi:hypothetical protein